MMLVQMKKYILKIFLIYSKIINYITPQGIQMYCFRIIKLQTKIILKKLSTYTRLHLNISLDHL